MAWVILVEFGQKLHSRVLEPDIWQSERAATFWLIILDLSRFKISLKILLNVFGCASIRISSHFKLYVCSTFTLRFRCVFKINDTFYALLVDRLRSKQSWSSISIAQSPYFSFPFTFLSSTCLYACVALAPSRSFPTAPLPSWHLRFIVVCHRHRNRVQQFSWKFSFSRFCHWSNLRFSSLCECSLGYCLCACLWFFSFLFLDRWSVLFFLLLLSFE